MPKPVLKKEKRKKRDRRIYKDINCKIHTVQWENKHVKMKRMCKEQNDKDQVI